MIQLFSNNLGDEELKAVKKVFESRWIGNGKEVELLEKEFGEKLNCKNVFATNCCTAALYMSMKILNVKSGDEVIIPSIHFIGASNAIIAANAIPVFADVEQDTLNLIPEEIERLITKKTVAVMLLHYGGHPAKLELIVNICNKYGLYLIEDSANSIFSKYKDQYCGTIGDIGCYSFDAMKIMCSGDGGILTVKDNAFVDKTKLTRYFGIVNSQSGIDSSKEKINHWWEIELGSIDNRYVMNNITATIAREQLKKLDLFLARRKEIWNNYKKELIDVGDIVLPPEPLDDCTSSYYMFWIKTNKRDELARYLLDNDIYCTFRYYPLHLIKQYRQYSKISGSFTNSLEINEHTLNIPLHQNLTNDDISKVVDIIKQFYR